MAYGKRFEATHWLDNETGEIRDDLIPMMVPKKQVNGFKTGWFAMSQDATDYIAENIRTVDDYRVLMKLASKLDFENLICISAVEVAQELKMKPSNFSRSVRRLKELGILIEGPRVGKSKTYRLNPNVGWKGSAKNHKNALRQHLSVVK